LKEANSGESRIFLGFGIVWDEVSYYGTAREATGRRAEMSCASRNPNCWGKEDAESRQCVKAGLPAAIS